MISTHLAQVGGAPNLAGLGGLVIWFSLAFFGLILGVLGSISGSLGGDSAEGGSCTGHHIRCAWIIDFIPNLCAPL
jgi:hypothetical protein